jgi:hypothetical protein
MAHFHDETDSQLRETADREAAAAEFMNALLSQSEVFEGNGSVSKPSASSLRAEAAEREAAEMRALIAAMEGGSVSKPSASSLRAEAAEREAAEMRAQIAAMEGGSVPKPSASSLRAEAAERETAEMRAQMAAMKVGSVSKPSASSLRAEAAEREAAEMRAQMAAMKGGSVSKPSASSLRAEAAEREAAELRAQMAAMKGGSVSKPSASSLRAEAAEREAAELKAQMAAMKGGSVSKPSASSLRAEAAEREAAKLKKILEDKNTPCRHFARGKCNKGNKCPMKHDEAALLKEKLKKTEAEMEMMKEFSVIKSQMKEHVVSFRVKFAKILKDENSFDLVVVMDCTGSMSGWMNEAKKAVNEMVSSLTAELECEIRIGFVAYRDFCDGSNRLGICPLQKDVSVVSAFIAKQEATGGGDGPEDVIGGIQAAIDMDWQAGAKLIVLVGDAPCHGEEFHTSSGQDSEISKQGMLQDPSIKMQMKLLAKNRVHFIFIEIQPTQTSKMTSILSKEFNSVKSDVSFKVQSLTDPSSTHLFSSIIKTAARESVTSSRSRSSLAMKRELLIDARTPGGLSTVNHYGPSGLPTAKMTSLAEVSEEDEEGGSSSSTTKVLPLEQPLDWDEVESSSEENAIRYSYLMRPSEKVDWANPDLKLVTQNTTVKISSSYFAKGAMRTAHGMIDMKIGKRFVAKAFYRGKSSKDLVSNDVETQAISKQLAHEYSSHGCVPAAIDFIHTSYYELTDRSEGDYMKWIGVEPYIAGTYTKYNSNGGYVNKDMNKEFASTTQSFSHFTWNFTWGNLMVVDLQGVEFIMTDPQIHSLKNSDTKYGEGNLGMKGMAQFFATHKCNDTCRKLKLSPFNSSTALKEKVGDDLLASGGGGGASDDLTSVADGDMKLSCVLCGDILTVKHSEFLDTRKKKRQCYCKDCSHKVSIKETMKCASCDRPSEYSPYWYSMVGMEPPKTCSSCKESAKKRLSSRS